jgi:hypothetical protein
VLHQETEEAISNLLNPWLATTNNIFAPLRNITMENVEPGREGICTKTPESYCYALQYLYMCFGLITAFIG